MKKIIFSIFFLVYLISCGKENELVLGSKLISEKQFINSLESLCKSETDARCPLEKLDIGPIDTILSGSSLTFDFQTTNSYEEREDIEQSETVLTIKNKNTIIDSLVVGQTKMGTYFYRKKLFYLSNKLELWILEYAVTDDPNNLEILHWRVYKIDEKSGKILLKKVLREKRNEGL